MKNLELWEEVRFNYGLGMRPAVGKNVEVVPDASVFPEAILVGEVGALRQSGLLALKLAFPK